MTGILGRGLLVVSVLMFLISKLVSDETTGTTLVNLTIAVACVGGVMMARARSD